MAHYWYALLEQRALLLAKPGTRRLVGLKLAAEMVPTPAEPQPQHQAYPYLHPHAYPYPYPYP